jgi:hypothetical protein
MNHKESYDFFQVEAVDEWVRTRLSDYTKFKTLASLSLEGEIQPAVLVKFAELAKTLGMPIMTEDYGKTLYVKKLRPVEELRRDAVGEMRRAHERGEIDDNGHAIA